MKRYQPPTIAQLSVSTASGQDEILACANGTSPGGLVCGAGGSPDGYPAGTCANGPGPTPGGFPDLCAVGSAASEGVCALGNSPTWQEVCTTGASAAL